MIDSTRSTTGTGATIRKSAASTGAQTSRRGRTSATIPTSAATRASQALRVRLTISARLTMPSAVQATLDDAGTAWIDAGNGYQLTLDGTKLAARGKGKRLASVPKELRDGDVADQLEALRDWLIEHERECVATVELWMLRSLAVPRTVLQAVWEDTAWRKPLENAVVIAVKADGSHDHAKAGLFRGVDPKKGVGIVDLDGETGWLATDARRWLSPERRAALDGTEANVEALGERLRQLHQEQGRYTLPES